MHQGSVGLTSKALSMPSCVCAHRGKEEVCQVCHHRCRPKWRRSRTKCWSKVKSKSSESQKTVSQCLGDLADIQLTDIQHWGRWSTFKWLDTRAVNMIIQPVLSQCVKLKTIDGTYASCSKIVMLKRPCRKKLQFEFNQTMMYITAIPSRCKC